MNTEEKMALSTLIVELVGIQTRTKEPELKVQIQKAIEKVAALIENATPDRDYRREVPTSGKSHFAEKNLTKRGRA
ncbi:hypothetical protein J4476_01610 [Candidatus Woesearchaeota archaeon]|nr:MAG: hypothetical protein QT09_C0012G0040 [archaeon GW2011_AR18]MBS3161372.1 hypothetical protein [Candidatus Woesearchaeota archaeon]HIH25404.1 hypothetical protein [Nanoarchaeota archaeon]